MKKFVCILLAIIVCFSLTACASSSSDSKDKISNESKAIQAVKDDLRTKYGIANLYGLEYYQSPQYTTCTAQKDGSSWAVTLKGTINGYTDEYRTDFVSKKKFVVEATVTFSGTVIIESIKKG